MFPEVFCTEKQIYPSNTNIFCILVIENRLLTPQDYDDIKETRLKYEIGYALAIDVHNDAKQVDDFLSFYGVHNPIDLIIFKNKNIGLIEQKTIQQTFIQYLDIFGRPSHLMLKKSIKKKNWNLVSVWKDLQNLNKEYLIQLLVMIF